MLYSLTAVKENLRNREGRRVFYLGKGDQLTSEARDFLCRERIEILPAEEAKPQRWKLLGGGYCEEKPEDMTHLNGDTLVKKTHPRIRFRGMVDMLEAELLLCIREVPDASPELEELLRLTRMLIRWELLEEPAAWEKLCGMTEQELRHRSHFPQQYYGIPHFMPDASDSWEILRLNRLRCSVRQAELVAAEAFSGVEGICQRPDIMRLLNRMSSMVYLLMLRQKTKTEGR